MPDNNANAVFDYLTALQKQLTAALADVEGGDFHSEEWQSALGHGRIASLQDGDVFERGSVNFSRIAGTQLPPAASVRHPQLSGQPYEAGGVSLILHPRNPYCPTAHMNVRWFQAADIWWFGGGMDLTPYYGFVEDCRHFHQTCRAALQPLDEDLYPHFKRACDDYFLIRHRQEARGIGGIFFDDFNERSFAHAFAVAQAVGDAFIPAYLPLIEKRRHTPYGDRQREWQQLRRGRYVEFNLVYDRGTLFGLQAGGNAEAILMSMPPSVRWGNAAHAATAEEESLLNDFLPPRDWA